jgi:hypothetical protein
MAIKYVYQPFPFQSPPKLLFFGLKKYHLATLLWSRATFDTVQKKTRIPTTSPTPVLNLPNNVRPSCRIKNM